MELGVQAGQQSWFKTIWRGWVLRWLLKWRIYPANHQKCWHGSSSSTRSSSELIWGLRITLLIVLKWIVKIVRSSLFGSWSLYRFIRLRIYWRLKLLSNLFSHSSCPHPVNWNRCLKILVVILDITLWSCIIAIINNLTTERGKQLWKTFYLLSDPSVKDLLTTKMAKKAESPSWRKSTVTYLDYKDIPMMNQDLETPTLPAVKQAARDVVLAVMPSDLLKVYNFAIPGVVKNLIDWRPCPWPVRKRVVHLPFKTRSTVSSVANATRTNVCGLTRLLPFVRPKWLESFIGTPLTQKLGKQVNLGLWQMKYQAEVLLVKKSWDRSLQLLDTSKSCPKK